jgi:hypothetical protein
VVTVLAALLGWAAAAAAQVRTSVDDLPDAPSARLSEMQGAAAGDAAGPASGATEADPQAHGARAVSTWPCKGAPAYAAGTMPLQGPPPCVAENPVEPIVTSAQIQPLSSEQKGKLALKEFLDPFNLVTIAGYSAIAVAANSHTSYGPGVEGWAKLTGYGLAEDAQGVFLGTYAIPSLVHEDPRYHRLPNASMKRRVWHAVKHTFVSQHDDGRPMINYATLLTYPLSAELSNLYVPGIQTDGRATTERMLVGIATDPVGQIVAEFLPDVAKHIHLHAQFAQELIDRAMTGSPNTSE